jgi:hypothetical protein
MGGAGGFRGKYQYCPPAKRFLKIAVRRARYKYNNKNIITIIKLFPFHNIPLHHDFGVMDIFTAEAKPGRPLYFKAGFIKLTPAGKTGVRQFIDVQASPFNLKNGFPVPVKMRSPKNS